MSGGERADRFESMIRSVSSDRFFDLPDMTNQISHIGKYARPKIDLPEEGGPYRLLADKNGASRDLTFSGKRLLSIGKRDSRHEVYFGQVRSANGEVRDVAVKDHLLEVALGEIAMMQYASKLGLTTYPIEGLYVSDKNHPTVGEPLCWFLTKFRPGIESMDSINWSSLDREEKSKQVQLGVLAIAEFHRNFISHGDSALKNIVQNRQKSSRAYLIDLEHATSFRDICEVAVEGLGLDQRDAAQELLNRRLRKDLRDLQRDVYVKVLPGQKPGSQSKWWKRNAMDPYIASVEGSNEYGSALKLAGEVAIKQFDAESRQ